MQLDSLVVREFPDNRTTAPHVLPLYATSSFAFENIEEFEQRRYGSTLLVFYERKNQ